MDQATVSRDFRRARQNSPAIVLRHANDYGMEFTKMLSNIDEISNGLWEVADDKDAKRSEALRGISLLMKHIDKKKLLQSSPVLTMTYTGP